MSKVKYNSKYSEFLLAVGLSSNLLGYTLGNFEYAKYIILLCVLCQIFLHIRDGHFKIVLYKKPFLLYCTTIFLLCYSYILFDYIPTKSYFLYFIIYSVFSFLFIQRKINFINLLNYLVIILFFCSYLPISTFINSPTIGYLLGISYNFLPGYLATLFFLFFYRQKNLLTILLSSSNFLIYSIFFIYKGNRGILLLVFLYLCSKYLFKKTSSIISKLWRGQLLLLLVIIFLYIENVVLYLGHFFAKIGIPLYALEKAVALLTSGEHLDNGRGYLIRKLFSLVELKNLISGGGVGFVEHLIGIYSHNLFVQYLFEGGILYLICLLVSLYHVVKQSSLHDEQNEIFRISLFAVIGQLMLSNVYWLNPFYWYIIYLALSKKGQMN